MKKLEIDPLEVARDCPDCKSKNTLALEIAVAELGGLFRITVECHDCGQIWKDRYEFGGGQMDIKPEDVNMAPRDRLEHRVVAEFKRFCSKIIVLCAGETVTVPSEDVENVDVKLETPLVARVAEQSALNIQSDVVRWCDDWLDPYWDLEILENHPQLEGCSTCWMHGPSYNIDMKERQRPNFKLAMDVTSIAENRSMLDMIGAVASLLEPGEAEINVEYERGMAELMARLFTQKEMTTAEMAIVFLKQFRPEVPPDRIQTIYYCQASK